jgi:hypothetical protein
MKKVLTLIIITASPLFLFSQNVTFPRLQFISDSVLKYTNTKMKELAEDTSDERYFSRVAYDRFFDKYFTQMQFERETFTEGNSAALKVDDKTTTLNLTLSHKTNNKIFSVGTVVNVSDGSGVLFSGNKPTSGTELFTSLSYLFNSQRKLSFQGNHMERNWRKRKHILDSIEMVHAIKIPWQAQKLYKDTIRYNSNLIRYTDSLHKERPDITLMAQDSKKVIYRDSIVLTTELLYKATEELQKLDDGIEFEEDLAGAITDAADKLAIQRELETPGVTVFRLVWASGGIRYRKDNYATYDSNLVFSKRIGEKLFDKWTFKGSINFLWQKTDAWLKFNEVNFISSFYGNVSWALARSNSFQDLKEGNLSLLNSISNNDSVYEFSKPYKLRDISNKTFTQHWVHTPSITLTPIFGTKQFFGLNLITSAEFKKGSNPIFNFRSGLLFRFKDSEKEKSFLNFEIFFSFQDLTDTQQSGKSAWQNKQIGVAANIPFQKVFFR